MHASVAARAPPARCHGVITGEWDRLPGPDFLADQKRGGRAADRVIGFRQEQA